MQVSQTGINLVKKWEGLLTKAYQDTGGVWTIGYGHTKGVTPNMVITEKQAEQFLIEDLQDSVDWVNRLVKVPVNQNQFDALVSFVFNIGPTQFNDSTMLRKLNTKDYNGAANEFKRWKYDNGRVIQGLVNRRADEEKLYRLPYTPPLEKPTEPPGGLTDDMDIEVIRKLIKDELKKVKLVYDE